MARLYSAGLSSPALRFLDLVLDSIVHPTNFAKFINLQIKKNNLHPDMSAI